MKHQSSIFILILIALVSSLFSQETKAITEAKASILLKSLNYNKTLKNKIHKQCVIAVLYNPQSQTSTSEKNTVLKALKNNKKIKVFGKKIRIIEIPMTPSVNLEKNIILKKINAFWVVNDLLPYIPAIRESARYNQVITITTDSDLVKKALVALGSEKTAHGYKIMVNLPELKNIKIDMSSDLLGQAILIRH